MSKRSLHILPFYSNHKGLVKVEHCNLEDDNCVIRGLPLYKERLDKEINLFYNGTKIQGDVFVWKIDSEGMEDLFKKGLRLTEEGLK